MTNRKNDIPSNLEKSKEGLAFESTPDSHLESVEKRKTSTMIGDTKETPLEKSKISFEKKSTQIIL